MTPKQIVEQFYNYNLAQDKEAIHSFHKDCKIHWNSSKGLTVLDYSMLKTIIEDIQKAYLNFCYKLTHSISENETVCVRYTIFATTIEYPSKEVALGHFISIVEVKDNKIFKIFQISHEADNSLTNMSSF